MPWWVGNLWLVVGVAFAGTLHGWIWFRSKDSAAVWQWRRANFTIAILGAIGLVSTVLDSRIEISKTDIDLVQNAAPKRIEDLLSSASSEERFYCNHPALADERYGDIRTDARRMCDYFRTLQTDVRTRDVNAIAKWQKIEVPLSAFNPAGFTSWRAFVINQLIDEAVAAGNLGAVSGLRFWLHVFAPYVLAHAFGLLLAKSNYAV